MNIEILCVGKLKESYFKQAVAEYEKRLSRYCRLSICEVTDEKTPDGQSEALDEKVRCLEGERLLKHVHDNSYVILLDIGGKMLDSVELSETLKEYMVTSKSNIQFIIGGSLGVSEAVRKRADERISFSKMTFPHQLMRVILLEQLYRGFKIMSNEPYHK